MCHVCGVYISAEIIMPTKNVVFMRNSYDGLYSQTMWKRLKVQLDWFCHGPTKNLVLWI